MTGRGSPRSASVRMMAIIGVMPTPPAIRTCISAGPRPMVKPPIRPVDIDALPDPPLADPAGEVAKVSDRQLDTPVRDSGAGRKRKRVAGDLERTAEHREPAELAGAKAETEVTGWPHRKGKRVA